MPVAYASTDAGVEFQGRARKLALQHATPPAVPVKPKTGPRNVNLIVPSMKFSSEPSDLELETARVFREPLAPMTYAAVPGECGTCQGADQF